MMRHGKPDPDDQRDIEVADMVLNERYESYRQRLFNHMADTHGLHLLESQMDDIERIVCDGLAESQSKVERYEKALKELSVLGGGRSEGNFIAQHALK